MSTARTVLADAVHAFLAANALAAVGPATRRVASASSRLALALPVSSAAALSTKYICSENSQKKTDIFLGPPSGTVTIPTSERTKTGESVLAASYERIPDLLAPTDLKYVLTVKSCNDQGEIGLYDPSYESKMLTASGTWVNAAIGANYARGRFGETETAWVAPALDQNQWWQIDSNDGSKTVVGAAVKGRTDERSQFVKIWKFQDVCL